MVRNSAASLVTAVAANHRSRLQKVRIEGDQLTYVDTGPRDGKVIVLLHGLPTSSWLYREIYPVLAGEGFRVIAPDLLGFGASDKPEDLTAYSPDKQAARTLALMRGLGVGRWTQVCHDLGGMWTWEVIDREPQHIERLVILNTTAYLDGFKPPSNMRMVGGFFGPLMLRMMRGRLVGRSMARSFFEDFVAHPERLDESVTDVYWLSLHEGTTRPLRQVASNFDFYLAQFDRYQRALRRLRVPAMIIWGKKDPVLSHARIPDQFARDLNISRERVRILEDASHFVQEDQPAKVANLIHTFAKESGGS